MENRESRRGGWGLSSVGTMQKHRQSFANHENPQAAGMEAGSGRMAPGGEELQASRAQSERVCQLMPHYISKLFSNGLRLWLRRASFCYSGGWACLTRLKCVQASEL